LTIGNPDNWRNKVNTQQNQIKQLKKIQNPIARKRYVIYFQLPPELGQLFFAEETANKMRGVSEKNNLTDDQLRRASHTAGMILLGEVNIVNFVKTLQEKCELEEEPARQLARDINQAVFLPVKESLKQIHKVPEWPQEDEPEGKKQEETPEETGAQLNGNVVDLKGE